jgi:hypothetical protein
MADIPSTNGLASAAALRVVAQNVTNMTGVAAQSATNYTDSATNSLASSLVPNNALAAVQPFDFATMAGMYRAISNIVHALGGSVTNFPAIPAQ